MRIVYFTHALSSCWNHGNAHFLRGVLREWVAGGHDVRVLEPEQAWSKDNLRADHGAAALESWRETYPELHAGTYTPEIDLDAATDGAELVIVHEWNPHELVARLGALRRRGAPFQLLFHDTHHRAVSAPAEMRAYDLSGYDGVLAFGETLSQVYRDWGWGDRVFTWHEAADIRHFHPPAIEQPRDGAVWIGNWGDGERTAELREYLFAPAQQVGVALDVYGVRYPDDARKMLAAHGAQYRGWLPNAAAPATFARHLFTVHVPRRFYVTHLPGIPTIRVFEALACGIPLISAPWRDSEALFTPGRDFLVARDEAEMQLHMRALLHEPALRAELARHGLATIRARHTCAHRARDLLGFVRTLSHFQKQEA